MPCLRSRRRILPPSIAMLLLLVLPAAAGETGSENPLAEYRPAVERIIRAVRTDNAAFGKLQQLCDDIGHRLSGSAALDRAIEWAERTLRAEGAGHVERQTVMVPKWERGDESLTLVAPREKPLRILGLGGSVGTPAEGITAPVLVVTDLAELGERSAEADGKIVLFNAPMPEKGAVTGTNYGRAVRYRTAGARMAAPHGAVAVLVRSVTMRSLQTPHTGGMNYFGAGKQIPAAAITIEGAELLARLQERGIEPVVTLKMEARMSDVVPSANVIAELRGREKPDEIVVISAHLDSWDVGQGALDDGGGVVTCMEALRTLKRLDLIPRRTIRVVLYTNEENGANGGKKYALEFKRELDRHVAAIESDAGVLDFLGFSLEMADGADADAALQRLRWIAALMPELNPKAERGFSGVDIRFMKSAGVPLIGMDADMTHYFDVHHSPADTIDKVDPAELTEHVAAMTALAYVLADMPDRLDAPLDPPDRD